VLLSIPASEFEVESQLIDHQSRVKDVVISDVTGQEGISNFPESEPAFAMIEEPTSLNAVCKNSSLPLSAPPGTQLPYYTQGASALKRLRGRLL
jgi:hypothetical protein